MMRNTVPSPMRLATTASTATALKEMARRPAMPHLRWVKPSNRSQDRSALTAKTKVRAPVFVVVFNMLSGPSRPVDGCRESALPPGTDRALEAGTVNSIRRVGSYFLLPPTGPKILCGVPLHRLRTRRAVLHNGAVFCLRGGPGLLTP